MDLITDCPEVPKVDKGYCNNECKYNGDNCCISNSNKYSCSDCVCSTSGVITSPGFPAEYANFLEVSWIIQIPSGQLIGITFISFDVEGHAPCP